MARFVAGSCRICAESAEGAGERRLVREGVRDGDAFLRLDGGRRRVVAVVRRGDAYLRPGGAEGGSRSQKCGPSRVISRSPGGQHGVMTSAQLVAAGGVARIRSGSGSRAGWLRSLHRGVYLVGPLEAPHTAAMAAVLATGGVISHYPAAVLWDWRPPREGPIHVTLPTGGHNRARHRRPPRQRCTPPTSPAATASPSPPPPGRSSTSPRPNPPPSSTGRSTRRGLQRRVSTAFPQ